ncbi:MAG: nascent polypeptide-associated complex protein [DPANN group archaeon]|nr:nascent polypeptide-associated complex protein [DPANN group archaeon]
MIPGMNPKMMKKAMQQMGMQMKDLDASEVIIKLKGGTEIVIQDPQVSKVKAMGQESYQIVGESFERSSEEIESGPKFTDEDVKLVMDTVDVSEAVAKEALDKFEGDLAQAISSLQE